MSDETSGERFEEVVDFVRLGEGCRVAVIGRGAGPLSELLRGRGHSPTHVDPSRTGESERKGLRLPHDAGSFDAVFLVDELHRCGHPEEALGDAVRVLRSGGTLVVEEPVAGSADDAGGRLTSEEICGHYAGEQLAVTAHRMRSGGTRALWVLQAPPAEGAPRRTYVQEDR
jgi:SAM-dependent methyltransferase